MIDRHYLDYARGLLNSYQGYTMDGKCVRALLREVERLHDVDAENTRLRKENEALRARLIP